MYLVSAIGVLLVGISFLLSAFIVFATTVYLLLRNKQPKAKAIGYQLAIISVLGGFLSFGYFYFSEYRYMADFAGYLIGYGAIGLLFLVIRLTWWSLKVCYLRIGKYFRPWHITDKQDG